MGRRKRAKLLGLMRPAFARTGLWVQRRGVAVRVDLRVLGYAAACVVQTGGAGNLLGSLIPPYGKVRTI
jgi:hypothetical protein